MANDNKTKMDSIDKLLITPGQRIGSVNYFFNQYKLKMAHNSSSKHKYSLRCATKECGFRLIVKRPFQDPEVVVIAIFAEFIQF